MWLIGKLIEIAVDQLYECAVIDWWPGSENAPETFEGEAEITYARMPLPFGVNSYDANFYIFLGGIFCIIDAKHLECWHSSKLEWGETGYSV